MEKRIKGVKIKERKLPSILTEEEIFKLFGVSESERDRLILKILYYTGLRNNEMIQLKKVDVNFKEKVIRIRAETTKTRREDFQAIPKPLFDDLKKFCEYKQSEDRIIPLTKQRIWQLVKYYVKKAKIEKDIHPHSFRHTYGTHIYEKTNDLGRVQELLRHSSIASTGIYKHLSKEAKQKTVDDVFK